MQHLKMFIHWLHLHPHYAGIATFFISFSEALALVGLIVPGIVLLTAIGTLMGAGIIPIFATMLWAIAGAILGDSFSYWIGHHFKDHLQEMWPFKKYPELFAKGRLFFQNHGGKSVILGRYIGPLRPIMPMIAGMMRMPPQRFLIANIFSGVTWAPIYMAPGMLIGAAALELPPEAATKFILIILLLILVTWLSIWLIRHLFLRWLKFWDGLLAKLWIKMQAKPKMAGYISFLSNPQDKQDHHQFTLFVVFLILAFAFTCLSFSVIHNGFLTALNYPTFHLMRSLYTPTLQHIAVGISMLAKSFVIIPAVITVFAWLFWRKHIVTAFLWAITCGAGTITAWSLKFIFNIPRPSSILGPKLSGSYPSGHSFLSVLIFGFLAVIICAQLPKKWHWIVSWSAGILCASILITRLYLGEHWLTDVVGGALFGGCFVLLGSIAYHKLNPKSFPVISVVITFFITLLITWSAYFYTHYDKIVYRTTPFWPSEIISFNQWWQQSTPSTVTYRRNHFGKPLEAINIQWAGSLSNISKSLLEQGWQIAPQLDLQTALDYFSKTNKSHLSVLPKLFQDRPPVATFILNKEKKTIVLRLWNAYIFFNNYNLPLWYGTLNYQSLKTHHFKLQHQANETSQVPAALSLLSPYLNNFDWKLTDFIVPDTEDGSSVQVLLVKPKSSKQ